VPEHCAGNRRVLRRRRRRPEVMLADPAELAGRPHVMVDGAPADGTVLTVSHWPRTPTPVELWADLSTESAVALRHRPDWWPEGVGLVTADHADVDAVTALAALTVPELTDDLGDLLVEVARVGDFQQVRDRRAALVAFALDDLLGEPLGPATSATGSAAVASPVGQRLAEGIAFLGELVTDLDRHRPRWAAQAASYDRACAALAAGEVVVEEDRRRDLAVVRAVGGAWPDGAGWAGHPLHPAAVHGATSCLRVATVGPDGVRLRFRYETWVRLRQPPRQLRVDLGGLAAELTHIDPAATWVFEGAAALRPELRTAGCERSGLDPEQVLARCRRALDELAGTTAWDPYR